ncbi:DciA family protein [Thiovibrio sp. JS02]
MARTEKLTRIDSLLAELFKKRQWERRLGLHAIFRTWPRVVGREIAGRAAPQVIRGTVLWVAVSDSVWMQQLHLQKQQLLEYINNSLDGPETISDIRFQLDVTLGQGKEDENGPAAPPALKPIDPEQRKDFERLLAGLPDEENRRRLLSLWIKAHQRPLPEKE